MSTFSKILQAGYIYAPTLPPLIRQVRSTIGANIPMEPTCCALCDKPVSTFKHEYISITSVMQGDYEGTPIDSSAIRAWFCWECFEASADSTLVNNFEKYRTFSGVHNESCLYCKKGVVSFKEELQKFFLITFYFFNSDGRNTCMIDEDCYVNNINV